MNQLLTEVLRLNDIQTPQLRKLAGQGDLEIFGFVLEGKDGAVELFEKLRNLSDSIGYWPIFLGGAEDVKELNQRLEFYTMNDVHDVIKASIRFDFEEWLKTKALAEIQDTFSSNPQAEKWLGFPKFPSFGTKPTEDLYLGLIPREASWFSPAYLAFGGWNDNPPASVHCALLKKWNRLYGAEVISITKDSVCLFVQDPPRDAVTAHQIYDEIFLYCPDSHERGIVCDSWFLKAIIDAPYWCFWWFYPWNFQYSGFLPQVNKDNSVDS